MWAGPGTRLLTARLGTSLRLVTSRQRPPRWLDLRPSRLRHAGWGTARACASRTSSAGRRWLRATFARWRGWPRAELPRPRCTPALARDYARLARGGCRLRRSAPAGRCFGRRHDSPHRRHRPSSACLSGHRSRRGARRSPGATGRSSTGAASARAGVEDARLLVFGVDHERALAHLRRMGVDLPTNIEFRGKTPSAEFRAALRRARAYVGGARWEDFGMAPLEALADGALLVTVPSGGPFEALALARRLAPTLVADTVAAEPLAAALRVAFASPADETERYRASATQLLDRFRPSAVQSVVTDQVVPALLGSRRRSELHGS